MVRMAISGALLIVILAGCRISEREGLSPLNENAPPLTFPEMLRRARAQAGTALDAFYVDAWLDLEQAAQRLEQTARHLPRSTDIPDSLKIKLTDESELLRKDAVKLTEAARAKNVPQANEAMQRIQLRIRQLRTQERAPGEKQIEKSD